MKVVIPSEMGTVRESRIRGRAGLQAGVTRRLIRGQRGTGLNTTTSAAEAQLGTPPAVGWRRSRSFPTAGAKKANVRRK